MGRIGALSPPGHAQPPRLPARQHQWRGPPAWLWLLACVLLSAMGPAQAATYSSASATYRWIDPASHAKIGYNTSPYKFNNTGCGSTPPTLDDTISDLIPIGFSFVFGGGAYTQLRVQSNGRVQFNNTNCGYGTASIGPPQTYPYALPDAAMNTTMKVFGVDLDPTNLVDRPNYPTASSNTSCASIASCFVSVGLVGSAPNRQFVITWNQVPEWVSASVTSGSFSVQVILNEDGSFVYQYGEIVHNGTGTAQVGWQLSTSDYQVLSFGASTEPPANTAIIFYIPKPVAHYWFEESAWAADNPGEVLDSSGNGWHGTAKGGAQVSAAGYVCRGANVPLNTSAGQVDAVATGINLSNPVQNLLGAGTIAFWVKTSSAWSGSGVLAAQWLDATTQNGQWFHLTRLASGALSFVVTDSTGTVHSVATSAQNFAAGSWQHVAVVWNFNGQPGDGQDHISIIVNGGTATTVSFTSSGTLATSLGVLTLGNNPTGYTSSSGSVNSADAVFDELQIFNYELTQTQLQARKLLTHACGEPSIDHLELQSTTWSGISCTPGQVVVMACADSSNPCTAPYTKGFVAMLSASGAATHWLAADDATVTAGAGQSSASKRFYMSAGSATLSVSTSAAVSPARCNSSSGSCLWTSADSGFFFDVPDHVSEVPQTVVVRAVRKSNSSNDCVPAFAGTSKSLNWRCSYSNPGSGTLPVRVGGVALNSANNAAAACDANGRAVTLAFDASGVSSTTVQYADVGRMQLTPTYTGSAASDDTGLTMTGSDSFVAAPASFTFSGITAGLIKAGNAFSATVSARNSAGATTPNFGRESVAERALLTFSRYQPTGTGAVDGSFNGNLGGFASGSATASDLAWSEVGSGDLRATLVSGSYLGSGFTATGSTGSTGAVGRFIPHHFDLALSAACGSFSYAGQPFSATVTARNAAGGTTLNYDGSPSTSPGFAKTVTLTEAPTLGLGTLGAGSIAANAFSAGVASGLPAYSFTSKTTTLQSLVLRVTDTDAVSSAGYTEGSMPLRSGRLRLSNAFGKTGAALQLPVVAEFWNGNAWVLNSADSCTTLPAASVAMSNLRSPAGGSTAATTSASAVSLAGGSGLLTLAAPSPAGNGLSLDIAINLGSSAADQSCLASHPASAGAAKPWLRAQNGACAVTADRDPAARASFGIFSPETRRTVHVREIF